MFERLNKYGVVINLAKCEFGMNEVAFLGHTVDEHGIKPLADRVNAINEVPLPANIKTLHRYLGMINFYRRFIPGAAKILQPLNDLLQRGKRATWPLFGRKNPELAFASQNAPLLTPLC